MKNDTTSAMADRTGKNIVPLLLIILLLLVFIEGCSKKTAIRKPDFLPELGLSSDEVKNRLLGQYRNWKGVRYRNGGQSKKGIDCSSFVQLTYRDKFGVNLPRTTEQQSRSGNQIVSGGLRAGDLILFKTGWNDRHIGMYLGKRSFLHVSESKGVIVSSLTNSYWENHYWQARRVFR